MLNKEVIKNYHKTMDDLTNIKNLNKFLIKIKQAGYSGKQRRILIRNYRKKHPKVSLYKIKYEWMKLNGIKKTPQSRKARKQYYRKRTLQHDYRPLGIVRVMNSENNIEIFLKMNTRLKNGEYKYTEPQLAKFFNTSLPSISYWRRKHRIVLAILDKFNIKNTKKNLLVYMEKGEKPLLKILKSNRITL